MERLLIATLALLLVAATALVFVQVAGFDFITYDDNVYVTENPHVQAGLTFKGFVWSFGYHEKNWHPLTWLSLMLDAELWGVRPAGFHLVNLLLHVANVLLLFFVLRRMTGCLYRPAFVAMLFAIHPLHVESVAWVAERKDVLSTFFWFLTLWVYVRYARRPSSGRLVLTGCVFVTGLLCKPMLVTLPVVLLLADFWPLERVDASTVRRLLIEKVPLFALAIVSSLITIFAQQRGGAVARLVEFPLSVRIENAAVSTIAYLGKAIWPARLSVFYPHPGEKLSLLVVAGCAALILFCSFVAISTRRSHPYMAFGWFWYLVTLAPVIGLVQVGTQGMADRYTYIPLVGPFIAIAWGVPDLLRGRRVLLALLASAVAFALGIRAYHQASYWRDSVTLFTHALAVTKDNAVAHSNLGQSYLGRGDLERAMTHGREVLRIEPTAADGHFNIGVILEKTGRIDEAVAAYREAVRLAPAMSGARLNLGILLAAQGQLPEAEEQLREAVRTDPSSFSARNNLGAVLAGRGAVDEAVEQFEAAARLDPTNETARDNLKRALELRDRRSLPPS